MTAPNAKHHAPILAALADGTQSTTALALRVGATANYAASILGLLTDRGYVVRVTPGRPRQPATWKLSGRAPKPDSVQPRVNISIGRVKAVGMPAQSGQPETVTAWMLRTGNRPEVCKPFTPVPHPHYPMRASLRGAGHQV